jgi:hypothetical protein
VQQQRTFDNRVQGGLERISERQYSDRSGYQTNVRFGGQSGSQTNQFKTISGDQQEYVRSSAGNQEYATPQQYVRTSNMMQESRPQQEYVRSSAGQQEYIRSAGGNQTFSRSYTQPDGVRIQGGQAIGGYRYTTGGSPLRRDSPTREVTRE